MASAVASTFGRAALTLGAIVVMGAPLAAQSRSYAGQSALPTARHVAANAAPAGAPRWACKTDCVVKLDHIDDARRLEPAGPLPAIASTNAKRVPDNLVKRTRTPVEDAVFESLDRSDRAKHYRYRRADGTKPAN
jgi:hypothetical protein